MDKPNLDLDKLYKKNREFYDILRLTGSKLERQFLEYWFIYADPNLPLPESQYEFIPGRKFALDWSWPPLKVAVELQGIGGAGKGRPVTCHNCHKRVRALRKDGSPGKFLSIPYTSHGSAASMTRDANKFNNLILKGWYPVIITSGMLNQDPKGSIEVVEILVKRRLAEILKNNEVENAS